ncbi:amino acid ABC transporter permease [Paraburkholderia aspalathi]|uniref:Putative glutamine transport system permease protein GlnP n=1 Tax=Paraburkholderia aspalathi TaxID=1324617 RepID=A0A1I7DE88_9BURK|nr:amino acid ABC transporter permease [Paraburkholderia aspalathi]SFU09925.1 amino acid ABC transporter membrane protein, PAAT family [Paraburkholderia aspalathi]
MVAGASGADEVIAPIMSEFFFTLIPRYFPFLLKGAWVTIELSVISMTCAIALGLAVALGRLSSRRWLDWLLRAYVEIWRDVPLVVQLLVIYFTLPQVGLTLPGFWAGVLGLALNLGAYLSEVFRAAIQAVDNGQREAGLTIGMSHTMIYRRVILPQALKVALPTIGGYFISLLKDSSLVSFIAVNELLRHGTIVIADTFMSMQVYLMVAIIYFAMSFAAARGVRWIEQKFTPVHRGGKRVSTQIPASKAGATSTEPNLET